MLKKRLIPCLIVKDDIIVQSINFKRYLPIGSVKIAIDFVTKWDVDEIIILDIMASKENRSPNLQMVNFVSKQCFVPLTVGGGIHTLSDIRRVISAGADKITINSEALNNPSFISEAAQAFGRQCIVVSIDIKKNSKGEYEVVADSGKKFTGLTPIEWSCKVEQLGAGEIFLNSVDRDGSKQGYDLELIKMVTEAVKIPVIACGGVGKIQDFVDGVIFGGASAVSAANIFHHLEHSTILAKAYLRNADISIRLNTVAKYDDFLFDEHGRLKKRNEMELENIWFERRLEEKI
jgi:cyclase